MWWWGRGEPSGSAHQGAWSQPAYRSGNLTLCPPYHPPPQTKNTLDPPVTSHTRVTRVRPHTMFRSGMFRSSPMDANRPYQAGQDLGLQVSTATWWAHTHTRCNRPGLPRGSLWKVRVCVCLCVFFKSRGAMILFYQTYNLLLL